MMMPAYEINDFLMEIDIPPVPNRTENVEQDSISSKQTVKKSKNPRKCCIQ